MTAPPQRFVPARAEQHHADQSARHADHRNSFATEMHAQMRAMVAAMNAAPMTGDPDRDFLAMMIPHHAGAVDMARLVLAHGRDPLTRQLADEIIASQQVEIASMTGRLRALEQGVSAGPGEYPALTGTRGP